MRYKIIRSAAVGRRFTCRACGAHADVLLHAQGESGWQSEGFFDPGEDLARRSAAHDLQSDAGRILSLVKCPSCGVRATRGVAASGLRWFVMLCCAVIVTFLFVAVAPPAHEGKVAVIVGVLALALSLLPERRRWKEAARCVQSAPVVSALPKAVAIARPVAPSAPLAPIASAAPEQVERASAEDGPSFLR